jgi:cell division protein FtsB
MKHRILLASTVVFAFLATTTPRHAWAQVPTVEQLTAQVAHLERRVDELEKRLRALETPQITLQSENRVARGDWRNVANWRRLRDGMSMDQVAELLGQPDKVEAGYVTFWYYGYPGGGHVRYSSSKKLDGWSEPSR